MCNNPPPRNNSVNDIGVSFLTRMTSQQDVQIHVSHGGGLTIVFHSYMILAVNQYFRLAEMSAEIIAIAKMIKNVARNASRRDSI